jgi:hypothetical protein
VHFGVVLAPADVMAAQISRKYSPGGTRTGLQMRAAKKPSSISKFIVRLSRERSSITAMRAHVTRPSRRALMMGIHLGLLARGSNVI